MTQQKSLNELFKTTFGVVLENTEDKVNSIKMKLGTADTTFDTIDMDQSVGSFDLGETPDTNLSIGNDDIDGFDLREFDFDDPGSQFTKDEFAGFDL